MIKRAPIAQDGDGACDHGDQQDSDPYLREWAHAQSRVLPCLWRKEVGVDDWRWR